MKKIIMLLMIVVVLTSCTDTKGARRALENAGYTPIKVGGFSFMQYFAEGKVSPNFFFTKFTAYAPSPNEKRVVSGVVTKGLMFARNTIKLD